MYWSSHDITTYTAVHVLIFYNRTIICWGAMNKYIYNVAGMFFLCKQQQVYWKGILRCNYSNCSHLYNCSHKQELTIWDVPVLFLFLILNIIHLVGTRPCLSCENGKRDISLICPASMQLSCFDKHVFMISVAASILLVSQYRLYDNIN